MVENPVLGTIEMGGAREKAGGARRKLSGQAGIPRLAQAWADGRYCEGNRSTDAILHACVATCASLAGLESPSMPPSRQTYVQALVGKRGTLDGAFHPLGILGRTSLASSKKRSMRRLPRALPVEAFNSLH